MDFTTPQSALQGMLATLRAARQRTSDSSAQAGSDADSSGLVELLQNTDFFPHALQGHENARTPDESLYDDLPALEEDSSYNSGVSSASDTRTVSFVAHDDVTDEEEDDFSAPPSSLRILVHRTLDVWASNSGDNEGSFPGPSRRVVATTITASTPTRELGSRDETGPSSPASSSGRSHQATEGDDTGVDSDSSMPTLQSVSDSSDEAYARSDSGSEWDDADDYYDDSADLSESEDEGRYVPPPQLLNRHAPTQQPERPSASVNATPNVPAPTLPHDVENTFQVYREVLDRARQVIPDLDQRLSEMAQQLHGGENDPKRAEVLLAGMEKVSPDLVRRYERLRMGDKEDQDGCAICRDSLLDISFEDQAIEVVALYAALPFHPELSSIIAFPCPGKHIFHADCLSPWLAQKTTCPSCRFDIDPHSVTHKRNRESSVLQQADGASRVWRPPQVETIREWLDAEEQAQASGVPRQRPQAVMPDYGPPVISMSPLLARMRHAVRENALATAPASPPTLPDVLDSPAPDWDYNPLTGNFDVGAALRDVEEMRQRFLNAEARRVELENILARTSFPAREPASQGPPRAPSAPPVPPSAASPSWLNRSLADEPLSPELVNTAWASLRERHQQLLRMPLPPLPPPRPVPEHTVAVQRLADFEQELRNMRRYVDNLGHRPDYVVVPTSFENVIEGLERAVESARADVDRSAAAREAGRERLAELRATELGARTSPYSSYPGFPVLNTTNDAPRGDPPFVRFPVPSDNHPTEPTNAFDEDEMPPPIQADPNQSLQAVAPLVIDREYMDALLSSSGVPPNVQLPQGQHFDDMDLEGPLPQITKPTTTHTNPTLSVDQGICFIMSYGQSRNTESWNNDPNNFSNPSGPDNRAGENNWNNQQQWGSQRPSGDPTDTSSWNSSDRGSSVPGQDWTAGPNDNYSTSSYPGNTTDANTYGAGGGNFGTAGRGAGVGGDNWQSRDGDRQNRDEGWQQQQGNNYGDDVNPGAGKTSMGERLKGNAEKLAGKVTGNPNLVEKGQVRKSGNPEDTAWNSNNY
ncbi:hypothetical protein BN946_scf184884.g18 [Trametes cinnabarina]|uniref:RING-type domain-containing protein n=1 Tax=Pycnoporus cinnabarinus TaxID=5643 RepID=A0A060SC65_PYCCI|nr:hypothetical protein BN946_scf184884.g18 [Trametes cinnabarina]